MDAQPVGCTFGQQKKLLARCAEECTRWAKCRSWLDAYDDRTVVDAPVLSEYASWIVSISIELGLVGDEGGIIPISEIKAWNSDSMYRLTSFEIRTIRDISRSYLSGLKEYKEEFALPPFESNKGTKTQAKATDAKLQNFFDGLMAAQKAGMSTHGN